MQLELDIFGDEEPDWSPLLQEVSMPPTTASSMLPKAHLGRRVCRECGKSGTTNQGGSQDGKLFVICDDCGQLDGCLERVSDRVGRHVSWWGMSHDAGEHDRLVVARDRRRAAWRKRQAVL